MVGLLKETPHVCMLARFAWVIDVPPRNWAFHRKSDLKASRAVCETATGKGLFAKIDARTVILLNKFNEQSLLQGNV